MKLTLYCNTYAGLKPRRTQYNQKNLMCGSFYYTENQKTDLKNNGFILDDTGKNISQLNHLLGDLTGLYWVWKNTDDEWVGTNQYRRFYDESVLSYLMPLSNDVLYVSDYVEWSDQNAWQQYISCHGEAGIKMLQIAAQLRKISIKSDEIYNIGSGIPVLFRDAIEYIIKKTNSKSSITPVEQSDFHKIVQTKSFFMNCYKLKNLGFTPKYNIYTTLDDLIENG